MRSLRKFLFGSIDRKLKFFNFIFLFIILLSVFFEYSTQKMFTLPAQLALLFCFFIILIQYNLSKHLFRPIHALIKSTRLIARGNYCVRVDIKRDDELGELVNAFNYMTKQLQSNIMEISEQKEYIENIITTIPSALVVINYYSDDKNSSPVLFCNERWREINSKKKFLPELLSNMDKEIAEILQGSQVRLSYEKKVKDIFYLIRVSKINLRIGHNSLLLLVDDISMRKAEEEKLKKYREHLESEISKRTLSLEKANENLKAEIIERKNLEEKRLKVERELNQVQKMESIGTLAAGIAHEINTPIQFISDNMEFIKMSSESMLRMISTYDDILKNNQAGDLTSSMDRISELEESLGFAFLKEEIGLAISQSQEGLERVTKIVGAMKDFSHSGVEDGKNMADINAAIESTIIITRNEWKYVADLKTDLEPALPLVPCFLGDVKQVILNLIVNSSHAIRDVVDEGSADKGLITISTARGKDNILISVSDTGSGIPDNIRERVFDHFFTTKEVGKGTGQGLSMAYGIIVEKHKGEIDFESEVGKGTTFFVRLPLEDNVELSES